MAEKQVKCPWCTKTVTPKVERKKMSSGDVMERQCPECKKVLAAYLATEGNFFPKIRVFEN